MKRNFILFLLFLNKSMNKVVLARGSDGGVYFLWRTRSVDALLSFQCLKLSAVDHLWFPVVLQMACWHQIHFVALPLYKILYMYSILEFWIITKAFYKNGLILVKI